jgi:hypothetical protein
VSDHVCCGCHDEEMYRAGQESGNPADGWVGEREEFVLPSLLGLNAHFLLPKPVMDFLRVSGAGLTEAGVPPLTLVSPGTPSEPSASPAAETQKDHADTTLPARPHGGPEDQAGAAAPACSCGHDAWEHTWRCNAQLAPDEWCDCIEWREA